jgi:glycosyltransferase involved in cell wall biosynthesis
MDQAEVFVAPMRIARGIQNKLLEALAMGLPCVASSATAKGTAAPDGEGILTADNRDEFAERVVRWELSCPDGRQVAGCCRTELSVGDATD